MCFFGIIYLITENVVYREDIRKIKNTITPLTRVNHRFVVVQSLSCASLFAALGTEACQAFLSFPISWSLLRLMSIESVMPSNHLILCHPFFCLQDFPASGSFPVSQFFSSGGQSTGASASAISPPNEYVGLISFRIGWFDLPTGVFSPSIFSSNIHS